MPSSSASFASRKLMPYAGVWQLGDPEATPWYFTLIQRHGSVSSTGCIHIPPLSPMHRVIIYFGGNGEDIIGNDLNWSCLRMGHGAYIVNYSCNVRRQPEPTALSLQKDAEDAVNAVLVSWPTHPIVIAGRSLGSSVAVYAACYYLTSGTSSGTARQLDRLVLDVAYPSFSSVITALRPWLSWTVEKLWLFGRRDALDVDLSSAPDVLASTPMIQIIHSRDTLVLPSLQKAFTHIHTSKSSTRPFLTVTHASDHNDGIGNLEEGRQDLLFVLPWDRCFMWRSPDTVSVLVTPVNGSNACPATLFVQQWAVISDDVVAADVVNTTPLPNGTTIPLLQRASRPPSLLERSTNFSKDLTMSLPRLSQGVRAGPTPSLFSALQVHGNGQVIKLQVGRAPVSVALKAWLNTISMGGLAKEMRRLQYTDVFHLFLVLTLQEGSQQSMFLLDKTQVVNLSVLTQQPVAPAVLHPDPVPLHHPLPTLGQLVGSASKAYGDQFWNYSVSDCNCQHFCDRFLSVNASALDYPSELKSFILQDSGLFQALGPLGRFSAQTLPRTAAVLHHAVIGNPR